MLKRASVLLGTVLVAALLANLAVISPSVAAPVALPWVIQWDRNVEADVDGPVSIAVASDGSYYAAGYTLAKYAADGTRLWRLSPGYFEGTSPASVACDDDFVYLTLAAGWVMKFESATGNYVTDVSIPDWVSNPASGPKIDLYEGFLYITVDAVEAGTQAKVLKMDPATMTVVETIPLTWSGAPLNAPRHFTGIAATPNGVYLTFDNGTDRSMQSFGLFDFAGNAPGLQSIGGAQDSCLSSDGKLFLPYYLTEEQVPGYGGRISIWDAVGGYYLREFIVPGYKGTQVQAVACDGDGAVYAVMPSTGNVVKLASASPNITGLTSPSHPDPDTWYSMTPDYTPASRAYFTWSQSAGASGYSFSIDRNPTDPTLDSIKDTLSVNLTQDHATPSIARWPAGSAMADFDRDGNMDVVAAAGGARSVEIHRGNGDGSFAPSPTTLFWSGTWGWTYRAVVGDFNGDEWPDIAVTVGTNSPDFEPGFGVFLNRGDGTINFDALKFTSLPSGEMNGLATADFNADGNLDVVVAAQPSSIGICLGNGDGTFGAPTIKSVDGATQVQDVATGDFNGDSFPDIVATGTTTASVAVYYNDGTGAFTSAQHSHDVGEWPNRVQVADFNNDGWDDIATGQNSYGAEGATILTNNQDGTFVRQAVEAPGSSSLSDISAVDLNNDGAVDLIGNTSGLNYVFLNDGSGTVQAGTMFRHPWKWFLYSYITTGDLDGDGDTDAVVTGLDMGWDQRIESWINGPAATFADLEDGEWYFHIKPVFEPEIGGETSDLRIRIDTTAPEVWLEDIVDGGAYLCGTGGQFTFGVTDPNMPDASGVEGFFYGDDSGAFVGMSAEPVTFDLPSEPGIYTIKVQTADRANNYVSTSFSFTMVGDISGLTSPTHPDQQTWYTEKTAELKWDAVSGNDYSFSVDQDPDTEPDLVPDAWDSSDPLVYQGTYAGGCTVGAIETGDFNEDGFDDYVVGRDDDSGVVIQINNGDGTFDEDDPTHDYSIENPDSGNNVYVQDINVVDMDGDDHLDLVTANGWDNTIGVMYGNGDGTFGGMVIHEPEGDFEITAIDVADFSGDGRPDVLCVGGELDSFNIEYNDGDATFTSTSHPMGDSQTWTTESTDTRDFAEAADFNGDGRPDVAIGTYANGFFVGLNDADGDFLGEMTYSLQDGGYKCESLETGDVNGDGNIDVIASNDQDNIGVFIGAGDGTFELSGGLYQAQSCETVRLGDVDGDGHVDLIAQCDYDDEGIHLFAGDGTGVFNPVAQILPQDSSFERAAVGDFNADGLADIAAGRSDDEVEILFGQAAGSNATVGPLDDGVWYFHLRHLGAAGTDGALGGPVAHYRLNIGEPSKPEVRISAAYPSFTGANLAGFEVNGDADIVDGVFRLTPAEQSKAGSFFTKQRIDLSGSGFSSFFTINMYDGGGLPADGMCFVIQSSSASVVSSGKGLGYEGITPSLGIEFDTYLNQDEVDDPDDSHVGVNINGSVTSIKTASTPGPLAGAPWNVWVDYEAATGQLEVRMSDTLTRPASPTLEATVDLADIVGEDAFVGMTAATGGVFEVHDVESFYFDNDYAAGGLDTFMNDYIGGPAVVVATLDPAATPSGTAATVNVLLKDALGHTVADWPVSFSSTSTGEFSGTEATTDAEGRADVTFSPASAARYGVRVQAGGGFLVDVEGSVTHKLSYGYGVGGYVEGSLLQTVTHGSDGTQVTAVPYAGYRFTQWSDGSTDNPRADTDVTRNIRAAARFELVTYTLSYGAGAGGSIEGTATQTVREGRAGTRVTAVPDAGYHFKQWSDGSTDNPRIDTDVMGDLAVTAEFEINTYTVAYRASAGGSIEGSATQAIEHGSSATSVTAVADPGYQFVAWSDGVTTPNRTDQDITANKSLTAFFASNPNTLFYSAGPGGTIEGRAIQRISQGSDATTVTAVPLEGYRFVSWSDGLTTPERRDTVVTASSVLVATFEEVVGAPSTVIFTPQSATRTVITWVGAQGATGYRIWVNGRLVATVGPEITSHLHKKLLGPDATVEVEALGSGDTSSARVAGAYSNGTGTIAGVIRYNTSSPVLTTAAKRELTRIAHIVADKGFTSVEVAGHTSANPKRSVAYHRRLSLNRAKAARTYLAAELKRLGATATIAAKGYGTSKPVATNRTAKGRAKNRRVEIVVK